MSTSTIRLDDEVSEETTRIAAEIGLTFNAEKDFTFPVKPEAARKTVFDMSSDEFEAACQAAVAQRDDNPTMDYMTRIDRETSMITKVYVDGRVEYVID